MRISILLFAIFPPFRPNLYALSNYDGSSVISRCFLKIKAKPIKFHRQYPSCFFSSISAPVRPEKGESSFIYSNLSSSDLHSSNLSLYDNFPRAPSVCTTQEPTPVRKKISKLNINIVLSQRSFFENDRKDWIFSAVGSSVYRWILNLDDNGLEEEVSKFKRYKMVALNKCEIQFSETDRNGNFGMSVEIPLSVLGLSKDNGIENDQEGVCKFRLKLIFEFQFLPEKNNFIKYIGKKMKYKYLKNADIELISCSDSSSKTFLDLTITQDSSISKWVKRFKRKRKNIKETIKRGFQ